MKPTRMLVRAAIGAAALALAGPGFAQDATNLDLTSSQNPSTAGRPVTLTATVDALRGGAPTGSVAFTQDGRPIGSASLIAPGAGQQTVDGGYFHACGLATLGAVKCWGDNEYGQLGDGTTTNASTPVSVSGFASGGAIGVAAGFFHSCAITTGRTVACWGSNRDGQLGDGTLQNRSTPVAVSGLTDVVALAAGGSHTCALTIAGQIKCWGLNDLGQLGNGTTIDHPRPFSVTGTGVVVAITAGQNYTCALNRLGQVLCWGYNGFGELGDGTETDRSRPVAVSDLTGIVAIFAGSEHTCAISSVGGAYCWGYNTNGELGDGTTTERTAPVAVSGLSAGVAAGAAGISHTCALLSSGGVKCWGANYSGQLGDGTTDGHLRPANVSGLSNGAVALAAGNYDAYAVLSAGSIKAWGSNGYGQIGDGTTTQRHSPVYTRGYRGLVRARAQIDTPRLGAGTHTMGASYPGDAAHSGSSDTLTQTVN